MARKPIAPATPDILIQRLRDTAESVGWHVTSHQIDQDGLVIVTLHMPTPPPDDEKSS